MTIILIILGKQLNGNANANVKIESAEKGVKPEKGQEKPGNVEKSQEKPGNAEKGQEKGGNSAEKNQKSVQKGKGGN